MIAIDQLKKRYGTEMAAILLSCRVFLKTASETELTEFLENNEINWPEFGILCSRHRVRPVVYKTMGSSTLLPADVSKKIRDEQAVLLMNNWKLAVETERIILLLKANSIAVVPYKGTAFSKQFYGDLVSRESSDIDMIIDPADLTKAATILKEDGYLPEMEDVHHYLGERFYWYNKDYNLNKFNNGSRVFHLELHWAIAERFVGVSHRVNDYLYQTNQWINLVKTDVKVIDDTAHFSAILIHHALKDNFGQLKNILDLGQAIKQPNIQAYTPQLVNQFNTLHLKKVLSLSNLLTQQLMGISFSQLGDEQIIDSDGEYFISRVCAVRNTKHDEEHELIKWMKDTALLQDSRLRKLRFYLICFKNRFVPGFKDFKTLRFPKPLFFLYYLVKPFRTWLDPLDKLEEKRKLIPVEKK